MTTNRQRGTLMTVPIMGRVRILPGWGVGQRSMSLQAVGRSNIRQSAVTVSDPSGQPDRQSSGQTSHCTVALLYGCLAAFVSRNLETLPSSVQAKRAFLVVVLKYTAHHVVVRRARIHVSQWLVPDSRRDPPHNIDKTSTEENPNLPASKQGSCFSKYSGAMIFNSEWKKVT